MAEIHNLNRGNFTDFNGEVLKTIAYATEIVVADAGAGTNEPPPQTKVNNTGIETPDLIVNGAHLAGASLPRIENWDGLTDTLEAKFNEIIAILNMARAPELPSD